MLPVLTPQRVRMLFAMLPALLTPVLRIIHRVIRRFLLEQVASYTYRIALGPRAGQKALSLRTVSGRDGKMTTGLCPDAHGVARMQRSAIRKSVLRQLDRNGSRNALRFFRAVPVHHPPCACQRAARARWRG